jgi:pantothenate kinase
LGGGTFWGLLSHITGMLEFDAMLECTKMGDNKQVDMLVGDIYGTDYDKMGLKASTIASSFGKLIKKKQKPSVVKNEDMARSLLYVVR